MQSRHLKYFLVLIIAFILSINLIYAQDPPIKWGEIPMSDLQMKTYPSDTNASAVVLCDYGTTYFNNNLHIIYKRHERIKIFNEKGYKYGSFSIWLYTNDNKEYIRDIEGITYSLDKNGSIEKKELSEDNIFKDESNEDYTYYKFTMPNLKPGCIVDIKYEIESEYLTSLRGWRFQREIPERWSEYRIKFPKQIVYNVVTVGYENWNIYEKSEVNQPFMQPAKGLLGSDIVPCYSIRLAVKNAPALKDEPYITTLDDYVNKVEVQLYGYSLVGTGVNYVLKNWKVVCNKLLDNSYFGDEIDDTHRVTKLAEQLTKNLKSPKEKMIAIYNWVAKSIVWTGKNRLLADQDVNDVLDSKKGNSAEITFLLLSMYKSIGIESYPVILSTRSNGKIQSKYPIIDQFNYVISEVVLGKNKYYLDATSPFRPYDLLPEKILDVKGLVVKEDSPEWIGISSKKFYSDSTFAIINVDEEGNISGLLKDVYSGYGGVNIKQDIRDNKKLSEIAKDNFSADRNGFIIDSVNVANENSMSAPLSFMAHIHSNSYAQAAGDMIYINPQVVNRWYENVFKDRVRKFPVDYSFPSKISTFINIKIPSGFEIKDNINDTTFIFGRKDIYFNRKVAINGIFMQIKIDYVRNCVIVKPEYYSALKRFYEKIVSVEAEPLVLERIKKPETPEKNAGITGDKSKKDSKHVLVKNQGK
jgi:transglutaminase-like putative cysteine protease